VILDSSYDVNIFENETENSNNFKTIFNIEIELGSTRNQEGLKLRHSIVSNKIDLDKSVD
jgi:hypothetical protein